MQKTLKKSISILLSILMIVSLFAVVPFTASAAEETSTVTWDNNSLQKTSGGKSSGGVTLTTEQGNTRVNDCFYDGRGSATFKAPEGSVFTKIELKNFEYYDSLNFPGATVAEDGGYLDTMMPEDPEWIPYYTVTWTGESSEVTFSGAIYGIQSIVFTLKSTAPTGYTVTWKNGETTLETDTDVAEGTTPTYDGEAPTKAEDEQNTYTFSGWNDGQTTYGATDTLPAVSGDVTYTATFTPIAKPHEHDGVSFVPWTSTNSLPTEAGNYVLTSDVTLSGTWTVPAGETNLCLNGHGIKRTGNGNVITVSSGASLTLYDCDRTTTHYYTIASPTGNGAGLATVGESGTAFTGGYITGGNNSNGGGVIVEGTFTMNAGTIIGNNASNTGAGVFVAADGSFNMNDGALIGNTAQYGGGVGSAAGDSKPTSLVISGGTVAYNRTTGTGGGVHTNANGRTPGVNGTDLTIAGPVKIINNHTNGVWNNANAGGGVVIDGSGIRFNLSGNPVIKDNTAGSAGSPNNLYFYNRGNPKVNISGTLTNDNRIGVTMRSPGVFTTGYNTYHPDDDPADYFTSDDSSRFVTLDANKEVMLGGYFTVTWKDEDGTVLETDENVTTGTTPEFNGTVTPKPEDDEATYSIEWSPKITPVTGDVTYTAVNRPTTKRHYKIDVIDTAYNDTRTLIGKTSLWYDTTAFDLFRLQDYGYTTINRITVSNAGDNILAISGSDITIKKAGTESINIFLTSTGYVPFTITVTPYYTVTWKNEDGTVLKADEVLQGTTPTYDGEAPTKAADAQNTYTFAAWDDGTTTYVLGVDDLPPVTADVTYTAVFTAETNTYKVTWKNWDGNVLKADENVPYGTVPEYKGARPEKPDFEDTAYTFTGWTPEVTSVTGDVEYTAEFGVHELIGDYYYVNGQRVGSYYGLIKYDGDFYYVDKYAKIIKNDEHCLVTTNGWTFADGTPIPKATYSFDADGKMIIPNGLVDDYYYINGVRVGSYYGLIQVDGDYYYVDNYAKIVKNKTKFLNTTNGLTFADGTPIPKATYRFDADGKMIIPNGIDGDFYYINGVKVGSYYGLVKDGNDYYYVDANAKIVKNKNKYLTTTNDLTFPDGTPIPHKYFEFDADGKMIYEPAPAPAGKSFTKVTDANQIAEDNIGECTFAEAKAWVLANWDDVTGTGNYVDVVYFDGTDLKYIYITKDLSKQDFEAVDGDNNVNIYSLRSWFSDYGDDVYICSKAS